MWMLQNQTPWAMLLMLVAAAIASPQANGQWDARGFAAPGPDERVRGLAMHDDGSGEALYAGGTFTRIDGRPYLRIARYRDGQWSDVGGGVDGASSVSSLLSLGGDLIVAGSFTSIGGVAARNIAAWDGTLWRPLGAGLPDGALCLADFNGSLIAGCGNGNPSPVLRWDGASWQPMGTLMQSASELIVFKGELIAAGSFIGASVELGNVARWDGAAWQSLGGGTDSNITALAIYQGDLFASGTFGSAGGVAASRVARWDGKQWHALGAGLSSSASSMIVHEDRLVAGGTFSTAGGISVQCMAQWDGRQWSAFPGGVSADVGSSGVSVLLSTAEAEGQVLWVGGLFNLAGDLCANNIARHDSTGWSRLTECADCGGLSGPMGALAVFDDGRGEALYVAGTSRCAGTTRSNRIVRWDGRHWSAFRTGPDNGRIYALQVFDDGRSGPRVYATGNFTSIGGMPMTNIAMWDGRAWSPVGGGLGGGSGYAMEVFDDGSGAALYVGGTFTSAGGQPISKLARWNGQAWSSVGAFNAGNTMVADMLVWNDGNGDGLLIGGYFNSVAGVTANGLALWRNGQWSSMGSNPSLTFVRSLAAWPPPNGSQLIAAGFFSTPGQSVYDGLAIWNGATWTSIAPGHTSDVYLGAYQLHAMHFNSCDLLMLFSAYTSPGPFSANWLRVWNGHIWRPMGAGISDSSGSFLVVLPLGNNNFGIPFSDFAEFEGRLYYCGDFTSADGMPAANIAIWNVEQSLACLGDVNDSGAVDTDDLLSMLGRWGPCANCAEDPTPCGGDGVVNTDDLLTLLGQWGPCR